MKFDENKNQYNLMKFDSDLKMLVWNDESCLKREDWIVKLMMVWLWYRSLENQMCRWLEVENENDIFKYKVGVGICVGIFEVFVIALWIELCIIKYYLS